MVGLPQVVISKNSSVELYSFHSISKALDPIPPDVLIDMHKYVLHLVDELLLACRHVTTMQTLCSLDAASQASSQS